MAEKVSALELTPSNKVKLQEPGHADTLYNAIDYFESSISL